MDTVNYKCQNCGSPLFVEPGQVQAMCQHCRSQNLITIGPDGSITLSLIHKIDAIDNKAAHLLNTQSETLLATQRMREAAAAGLLLEQTTEKYRTFLDQYKPQMEMLEGLMASWKKENTGKTENEFSDTAGLIGCALPMLLLGLYLGITSLGTLLFSSNGFSFTSIFWLVIATLLIGFAALLALGVWAGAGQKEERDAQKKNEKEAKVSRAERERDNIQKKIDDLNETKTGYEQKIAELEAVILAG